MYFSLRSSQCSGISPDAGILHLGVGVEALGDGVADQGGALLPEQFNLPPLLLDQPINPRRLAVQKGGNGALLGEGRKNKQAVLKPIIAKPVAGNPG